jgi:transcription elongation factor Elf1
MSDAASIRKYPTRIHVRCPQCQHQGIVAVYLDKPPKLKCTRCGSRDAIVVTRDRTRVWSGHRRGR